MNSVLYPSNKRERFLYVSWYICILWNIDKSTAWTCGSAHFAQWSQWDFSHFLPLVIPLNGIIHRYIHVPYSLRHWHAVEEIGWEIMVLYSELWKSMVRGSSRTHFRLDRVGKGGSWWLNRTMKDWEKLHFEVKSKWSRLYLNLDEKQKQLWNCMKNLGINFCCLSWNRKSEDNHLNEDEHFNENCIRILF